MPMRLTSLLVLAGCLCLCLPAQTQKLPYDPNDPDGLVMFPNGTGRFVWKRKGIWRVTPLNSYGNGRTVAGPTVAERKMMTDTLNALSGMLRATPTGSSLTGFFVNEGRGVGYPEAADAAPGRSLATVPFQIFAGIFPFYLYDLKVNGQYVPRFDGETESVYFYFNRLPGSLGNAALVTESNAAGATTEFYVRPAVTGEYRGFPVYNDKDLVITRRGLDPWAPAPYGRVLKAAMAQYEKDRATAEARLAGHKKDNEETQSAAYEQKMREHLEKYYGTLQASNAGKWQLRVANMERELTYNRQLAAKKANPQRDQDGAWYWNPVTAYQEASQRLAAMTAEEAQRPACFRPALAKDGRYAMTGDIGMAGEDSACQPLVSDNRGYFDPKLSRGAAQIMVLSSFGRCAKVMGGRAVTRAVFPADSIVPPQGCQKHVPMWEEMDWQKVAALLAP